MNKYKFSWYSVTIVLVAAIGAIVLIRKIQGTVPVVIPAQSGQVQPTATPTPPTATITPAGGKPPAKPTPAKATVNLPIPFTPQAPTGNWDQLHEEACEEASSIMANAYLTGDTDVLMPPSQVESQIASLTTWQDQHFGYHLDTTAAETAQMITGYYGLHATVVSNYTLQNIEDAINQHEVVILPVNGQVIGNPYYTQPGPIYHMLVVRGYTPTSLITNDSGTKRGQNYPYTFSTLFAAGADWSHATNTIDQSKKVMVVVSK